MKRTSAPTDEFTLRGIVGKYLSSLGEELSADEVEDCINKVANSCLPVKSILETIAEDFLPFELTWSCTDLQKIADASTPLFGYETSPRIRIDPEVWFHRKQTRRVANAVYDWDSVKNEEVISLSARYLASCRCSPGKWLGTLWHELTHVYVYRTFAKRKNYNAARRNGHNVFFFNRAFSIEVQLELVLSEWISLRDVYGVMGLNLETTREGHPDLDRHYDWHLKKAQDQMRERIHEDVKEFVLSTREQRRRRLEERQHWLQFELEDYEDDWSQPNGDVSFCPQLLEQIIGSDVR